MSGLSVMRQLPMTQQVTAFFYGSYINREVLAEVNLIPERVEVARLPGFDLEIRPLANLIPSDRHSVYGILADATHDELERLYDHAQEILGGRYLPRAVVVHSIAGEHVPALCYIAPALSGGVAAADYVERILGPAREYGFPSWYLDRISSFAP